MNTIQPIEGKSAAGARRVPVIPASAFGIVLGVAGLANAWRAAGVLWNFKSTLGEIIALLAFAIWAVLLILYGLKWLVLREEAKQELAHPVQCCFVGLIGVSTMLAGLMIAPRSEVAAHVLFWAGALWTLLFAIWRTGALWRGGREATTTTPVLYLPTVAGCYVVAIVGASLGYTDVAQLAFGGGFFAWLAIESVLLNRLLTSPELVEALRPTIGIQLAPPAVGAAAYLSATSGAPDMLAHAMVGYAILQFLLMIRIFPWVMRQPFNASYWAFSFGLTALATDIIRMVGRGEHGVLANLALPMLAFVSTAMAILAIATLASLVRGKLFRVAAI